MIYIEIGKVIGWVFFVAIFVVMIIPQWNYLAKGDFNIFKNTYLGDFYDKKREDKLFIEEQILYTGLIILIIISAMGIALLLVVLWPVLILLLIGAAVLILAKRAEQRRYNQDNKQ